MGVVVNEETGASRAKMAGAEWSAARTQRARRREREAVVGREVDWRHVQLRCLMMVVVMGNLVV